MLGKTTSVPVKQKVEMSIPYLNNDSKSFLKYFKKLFSKRYLRSFIIYSRNINGSFTKRILKCNNKVVVKMADKVVLLVNALVYVIVIVKYVVKDI